jgi:hypothetical protein
MVPSEVPKWCLSAVSLGVTQSSRRTGKGPPDQAFMSLRVAQAHSVTVRSGGPYKAEVIGSGNATATGAVKYSESEGSNGLR